MAGTCCLLCYPEYHFLTASGMNALQLFVNSCHASLFPLDLAEWCAWTRLLQAPRCPGLSTVAFKGCSGCDKDGWSTCATVGPFLTPPSFPVLGGWLLQ